MRRRCLAGDVMCTSIERQRSREVQRAKMKRERPRSLPADLYLRLVRTHFLYLHMGPGVQGLGGTFFRSGLFRFANRLTPTIDESCMTLIPHVRHFTP